MWPQFKTNCLFIENNYLGLYDYYYLENEISRKLCNVFIYLLLFFSICAIILLLKVKKAGRNFQGFSICAIVLSLKVKKAGLNFRGLFFRFVLFYRFVLFHFVLLRVSSDLFECLSSG